MGHVFQAKCWEKYPSGHHLLGIMAKEKLAKEMTKALKMQKSIIDIYL